MGRLIVDGNQVYEIDEECLRQKTLPRECGVWKEMKKEGHTARAVSEKHASKRVHN
jgi:hypothetical protein